MVRRKRGHWLVPVVLGSLLWLSGCQGAEPAVDTPPADTPAAETPGVSARPWMDIALTDVSTGKTFRIGDFKGKPILLESFAVWCPTCTVQQRQIGVVKEREGEAIVHISLDTDPNEDEAKVREHMARNGFDWYYAVAPVALTRALIDEFGLTVVNAPQAPVILICEDQSARLLRNGVKSADDLISEVGKGCDG